VGVIVEMTPRVTFEGEIILELLVESSSLGRNINIAGNDLPSFNSRKVVTKLRLRDGESNLLAGLLQEQERKSLVGFPGLLRLPVIKQLFSSNDNDVSQTDIVMLLTPRLVRTHELTQQNIDPIFIGTQQNLGLGGPPPLIAPPDAGAAAPAASPTPAPAAPAGPVIPPGSSPTPGTTTAPTPPQQPVPAAPPPAPQQQPPTTGVPPTPPPAAAPVPPAPPQQVAQVLLTPPSPEFRVGGGPYTVPVSISNAVRVSTITASITYNPSVLRVRMVQEGSFMRQGGVAAQFTQQVDAAAGRVDIAIARTGDGTGASGVGLLAAVLFDTIAPGPANLMITGVAAAPGGASVPLQFSSAAVSVK
jgi:general secretion pathway protein D